MFLDFALEKGGNKRRLFFVNRSNLERGGGWGVGEQRGKRDRGKLRGGLVPGDACGDLENFERVGSAQTREYLWQVLL